MSPVPSSLSVVVPIHNGSVFLPDVVSTLRAQTRPPDEVILVDDGSTDDTAARAAGLPPPFRLVSQERQGPAGARNRALREVRGDLVAFLDVDDLWPPDKLAVQEAVLEREPGIDVVQGLVRVFPSPDEVLPARILTPHFRVNLGAGLLRRRLFEEVGAFDASMRFGEDFDWLLRAGEAGTTVHWLRRIALIYRRHGKAMTRDRDRTRRGVFQVVKQSLDRRREAGDRGIASLALLRDAPGMPEAGEPRVSVIMPAFNAERFIVAALASILSQTFTPYEVIVVDDGSNDETAMRTAVFPDVTLDRQEHRGVAAARNRGLDLATGDVVAWLDADDLWPPEALATQIARLRSAGGPAVIVGRTRVFRDAGHSDLERLAGEAGPPTAGELPGCTIASREIHQRVGRLDESLRAGAFMEWLLRARDAGEPLLEHEAVVLFRRLHEDNLGVREAGLRRDYLKVVRSRLRQRRAAEDRDRHE